MKRKQRSSTQITLLDVADLAAVRGGEETPPPPPKIEISFKNNASTHMPVTWADQK